MNAALVSLLFRDPPTRYTVAELSRAAGLPVGAIVETVASAFREGLAVRDGGYIRRRIDSDSLAGPGCYLWLFRQGCCQTQHQAAKAAGMAASQWSDLEADRRSPTLETLRRAAAAVGREVRELL